MNPDNVGTNFESIPDPRSQTFVDGFSKFLEKREILGELALKRAARAQLQSSERFDFVLTRLGLVPENDLAHAIAEYLGLPIASIEDIPDSPLFVNDLDANYLASNAMFPIADKGGHVLFAIADPFNGEALSALSFLLDKPVIAAVMSQAHVAAAIERLYTATQKDRVETDAYAASARDEGGDEDIRRLQDMASEAPIIRLVQDLINRAAETHASDIHLEPCADGLRVRMRVDGVLHTLEPYPDTMRAAVTSRIKIMAGLNIAERRIPQDGRIKATVRGREIDLRISTMPIMGGESVVVRLLDRSSVDLDFTALGFAPHTRDALISVLNDPNGIILVTGPTGSGKTTTLYTALRLLNSPGKKTFTIEDPIEYHLDGLNQTQVLPAIGLTFASVLRSVLRQDPDTIMVGEIRDLETARVAIQASLTGHLVLSTVHTNSAAATLTRLLDMGVESYLLASSVKAVLAQRLVRRLCSSCSVPDTMSPVLKESLEKLEMTFMDGRTLHVTPRRAVGCRQCRQTGFRGRTAVSELLTVTDKIQDALLKDPTERGIYDVAVSGGMESMFRDGLARVIAGETTLEEVLRITRSN